MSRILTPQMGRRHVVKGIVAVGAAVLVPGLPRGLRGALAAPGLVTTPAQTEGPYYPTD